MKIPFTNILLALFLIGNITTVKAQKIAHVDFDSLVSLMPETKSIREIAETYMNEIRQNMTDMEKEFQMKYNDYLANKDKMSELVRKMKEEDLQAMQKRMEEYNELAEQDYQKKLGDLSAPVIQKAKNAIASVAKESGYKYVFDLTGNIIYAEPSDDILNTSKKKLDTMPLINIPGSKSAKPEIKAGPSPKPR